MSFNKSFDEKLEPELLKPGLSYITERTSAFGYSDINGKMQYIQPVSRYKAFTEIKRGEAVSVVTKQELENRAIDINKCVRKNTLEWGPSNGNIISSESYNGYTIETKQLISSITNTVNGKTHNFIKRIKECYKFSAGETERNYDADHLKNSETLYFEDEKCTKNISFPVKYDFDESPLSTITELSGVEGWNPNDIIKLSVSYDLDKDDNVVRSLFAYNKTKVDKIMADPDPYVVQTNTKVHERTIGLAMEYAEGYDSVIHVQPYGKFIYDPRYEEKFNEYYEGTEHEEFNHTNKEYNPGFTYRDVGKKVYIKFSETDGDYGHLTVDEEKTSKHYHNIICLGYLTDAPQKGEVGKTEIEINISGDQRGLLEATQFEATLGEDVVMDSKDPVRVFAIGKESDTNFKARLCFTPQKGTFNETDFIAFQKMDGKTAIIHFTENFNFNGVIDDDDAAFLHMAKCYADIANNGKIETFSVEGFNDTQGTDSINNNIKSLCGDQDSYTLSVLNTAFNEVSGNNLTIIPTYCSNGGSPFGYVDIESTEPGGYYAMYISSGLRDKFDGSITTCHGSKENHGKAVLADIRIAERRDLLGIYYGARWDQTLEEGYTTVFMKLGEFDVPEHSQQFDGNFTAGQEYYLGMNGRITKYPYNQYDFVSKIGSIKYGVAGDLRFVVDIGHASRHYNGDLPVGYMKPAVKGTDNEYVAEYGFYLMDGETPHEKAHPNDVLYERLLGWFDEDSVEVSGKPESFKIPKVSRMMPDDTDLENPQVPVPMQIKYLPSGIYEEMPRIPFKRFFGKFKAETADNKNLKSNKSWTPVKCFIEDCDITDIVDYGITEDGYTVPGLDNLDIHLFVDPNENYNPAENKPHDWHEVREGFINWNNTTTFGYTWKIDVDPASKEHPYGCYRLSMDIGKSEGVAYVTADNQAPKKLNGCHYKLYVARREVFARQFDIEKIYKDYLTNSVYTDPVSLNAVTDRAVTGKAVLDAIENRTSIKALTAIEDSEIHLGREKFPTDTLELYTKKSLPIFSNTNVIIKGGQKTGANNEDKVSFEFIEGELKKIHSQTGFTEKNIFTGNYDNNKWTGTWNDTDTNIDAKAIPTIGQVRKHAEMRINDSAHSTNGDIHGMIFGLGGNIDASTIFGFKPKNLSSMMPTPESIKQLIDEDAYIPLVYKKDSKFNLDIEGTMSYYLSSALSHQNDNTTPALKEYILSGDNLGFIESNINFRSFPDENSPTYSPIESKKFLGRKYEINDSTRLFAEFYSNGNDKTLISKVLDFENGVLSLQQKKKLNNGDSWSWSAPVGLSIRVGSVEASSRSEYKRIHGETFRKYDTEMFPTNLAVGAVQYEDSKEETFQSETLPGVKYTLESCTNKFKTVLGSALQAAYEMPLAYWQYRTEKEWYKDRLGIIVERVEDVANNIKGKKQATATFGPLTITSKEYDDKEIKVEFRYVTTKESDESEKEPPYVEINVTKGEESFDFTAKTVGEAIAKNTDPNCPVRFSGVSDSKILANNNLFMQGKQVSVILNNGKSTGTGRKIFENLVDRNIDEANTTPEANASCTVDGLTITAKNPGVEGNNIVVKCTETDSNGYKLEVYKGGKLPENTYHCNANASFNEFKTDDAESPVSINEDTLVEFKTPDNFKLEPFTAHLVGGKSGNSVSRSLVNTDYQENEFQYTDAEAQSIKEYLTAIIDNSSNGQDVLSTIGLLLKAAQETQERLLKVEASTFGRDYETIPGDHEPYVLKGMPGVVPDPTNYGLNRLIRAICQELYYDSNPFDKDLNNDADITNKSSFSRIDRLDREIHGELNSEDNVQTAPNTLSEIDSSTYPYEDMIRAEDDRKIREAEFTMETYDKTATERGTNVKTRVDMSLYNKDTDGYYTTELEGNTIAGDKSGKFNGIVDAIYRITTKLNALTESINNSDNIADSPKRLNTIRQNIEHIIREAYFDDAYVIDVEGEVEKVTPGEDKNVKTFKNHNRIDAEPYHDVNGLANAPYTKNVSRFDKLTDDLYNYSITVSGEGYASFQNFYELGNEKVVGKPQRDPVTGKITIQDSDTQVYYTGRKFNGKHLLVDNKPETDGTSTKYTTDIHIPQNLNDYNYATLLDIVVDALGDEFFRKNVSIKTNLDEAWNNRKELRHNRTISDRLDKIEACLDKVVGKLSRGHSFEEETEAFDLGKNKNNTNRTLGTLNEPYSNVFSIDRYLQFMNDYLGYSQTTTNKIDAENSKTSSDIEGTSTTYQSNHTQEYTEHWANGYDYKIEHLANQEIDSSTDNKEPEYSAEWALTNKKKIHAGLVNMLSRIQNEETRSNRYDAILGDDFKSTAEGLSTTYVDFGDENHSGVGDFQTRTSSVSYNLTDDIQDLLKTIYGVDNHSDMQSEENGSFTKFIHRTEVQNSGDNLAQRFTKDSGGDGGNNIIDVMINEMYYLPQPLRPVSSNSDELSDKVKKSLGDRLISNLDLIDTVPVYIPTESTLHNDEIIKDSRAAEYYDFDSGKNVYDIAATEKALSWNNRDEFFNSIGRFEDVDIKTTDNNGNPTNTNKQGLHSRLSRFDVIENEIRSLRRLIGLDFDRWDGEKDLTELKFDGILKFFGERVNNGFSGNPFHIDVGVNTVDPVTDQFNASTDNSPTQTSILRFLLNADKSERLLRTELGFSDGYNTSEKYNPGSNPNNNKINGYWYWYDPDYKSTDDFVSWGKSENYNGKNSLENYGLYKQVNGNNFETRHSVYDRLLALEKNAVQVDAWLDSVKNIYRNDCGNGTGNGNIFDIVGYLGNYKWNNNAENGAARYYGSFGKLDLDNITIERYNDTNGGNTNYDTVTKELNEHHKALQNIYDVIGIDKAKDITTYVDDTKSNRKYSENSPSIVPNNKTLWARLNAVEELNQHDLDITNVITVDKSNFNDDSTNSADYEKGVINLTDGKNFPVAEYTVLNEKTGSLVTSEKSWEAGEKELIASKGYVDNKIVSEINRYAQEVDVGDEISATVKIDENIISDNQPSQTGGSSESSGTEDTSEPSTIGSYNNETNGKYNEILLEGHMYLSGKLTGDFEHSTEQKQNYYNAFTIDGLVKAINQLNEQNQKNVNNLYKNVNDLMMKLQYTYNADNNIQTTTGSLLSFESSTTTPPESTTGDGNENSSGGSGSEGSTAPTDSSNDNNGETLPGNNNSGSSSGNQDENQGGTEQQNAGGNGGTEETTTPISNSDTPNTESNEETSSDDNGSEGSSDNQNGGQGNTEPQGTGGTNETGGATDSSGSSIPTGKKPVNPEESTRDSEGGDEPKSSNEEPPSDPSDNQ